MAICEDLGDLCTLTQDNVKGPKLSTSGIVHSLKLARSTTASSGATARRRGSRKSAARSLMPTEVWYGLTVVDLGEAPSLADAAQGEATR